jgi:hypothetical protein
MNNDFIGHGLVCAGRSLAAWLSTSTHRERVFLSCTFCRSEPSKKSGAANIAVTMKKFKTQRRRRRRAPDLSLLSSETKKYWEFGAFHLRFCGRKKIQYKHD